ncbi:hypothetical protein CRUP_016823, partial [Coryphaenoides rupestris]
ANLALSPSSLLPSPRTPEVKHPLSLSPSSPSSPPPVLCTTQTPHHHHQHTTGAPPAPLPPPHPPHARQSSEEEEAVCFESAPEGTPLPSFNKTRARLSFKRRPPTRHLRQSLGEEGINSLSPWQPEPASPGPERHEGEEEEEEEAATERTSCDPAAPLNQSEQGREEEKEEEKEEEEGLGGGGHPVGDKDAAESADGGREADLATPGVSDASEGEGQPAAREDTATQDALRREGRENGPN